MRLALALALALATALATALVGASCGTVPGGSAAPAGLALRTDSLRVSVDSLQYTVAVDYPQIGGTSATVSADRVEAANRAVRDSVVAFAESFRPAAAVAPEDRLSPGFVAEIMGGSEEVFLGRDLFSAVVWISTYFGGARGNASPVAVNVDLRTGAALRLGDLFRAGSPWADTLSAHAGRALGAKARGTEGPVSADEARARLEPEGYAAAAIPDVRFTLGADSLALHFEPYEVATYAFGPSRVPVAYADLAALLRPDGPAARLTARRHAPRR